LTKYKKQAIIFLEFRKPTKENDIPPQYIQPHKIKPHFYGILPTAKARGAPPNSTF